MDFTEKMSRVQNVYEQFEADTAEFRQAAVCKPGCAYCCNEMGTIDITTLEGVMIHERLAQLKRPALSKVTKQLTRDIRRREKNEKTRCPLLQKNNRCMIYTTRPFSCRQLYSLKLCGEQGPTLHRQAVSLAKTAVAMIQAIDDTGYSGHLSYGLHMLGSEKFWRVYRTGGFNPEEIMVFGKSHNIVSNRMARKNSP